MVEVLKVMKVLTVLKVLRVDVSTRIFGIVNALNKGPAECNAAASPGSCHQQQRLKLLSAESSESTESSEMSDCAGSSERSWVFRFLAGSLFLQGPN